MGPLSELSPCSLFYTFGYIGTTFSRPSTTSFSPPRSPSFVLRGGSNIPLLTLFLCFHPLSLPAPLSRYWHQRSAPSPPAIPTPHNETPPETPLSPSLYPSPLSSSVWGEEVAIPSCSLCSSPARACTVLRLA
eukprot:RCo039419